MKHICSTLQESRRLVERKDLKQEKFWKEEYPPI